MRTLKILTTATLILLLAIPAYAGLKSYDAWDDSDTYKPYPVIFGHDFANGSKDDWITAKAALDSYFTPYQSGSLTYLMRIDFEAPNGSIDENGGWANTLDTYIEDKTNAYGIGKVNLVMHGASGLAGREYLLNYTSTKTDKLIMIGVPNLGIPFDRLPDSLIETAKVGWSLPLFGITLSSQADCLRQGLVYYDDMDINGDMVTDLTADSAFLTSLNNTNHPTTVKYYTIAGIKPNLTNFVLCGEYFGGDSLVCLPGQLGETISKFDTTGTAIYQALHIDEPKTGEIINQVFLFLDDQAPQVEITEPANNTQITEDTFTLKGSVTDEYLPAGLNLTVTIQEEGDSTATTVIDNQSQRIRPFTDQDPTPAGFEESITLPAPGTYTVSAKVTNLAGIESNAAQVIVEYTTNQGYYEIDLPGTIKVGEIYTLTITKKDANGNTDTAYSGIADLTENGAGVLRHSTLTITNGVGIDTDFRYGSTGKGEVVTLTATDQNNNNITSTTQFDYIYEAEVYIEDWLNIIGGTQDDVKYNYDTYASNCVGYPAGWDWARSLLIWDLTSNQYIDDDVPDRVELRLYSCAVEDDNLDVSIHEITNVWDSEDTTFNSTALGAKTVTTTKAWKAWDITSLAADWLSDTKTNHGLLIKLTDETDDEARTSCHYMDKTESSIRYRATLYFYYAP